jgi:Domain of unknown function (DUF1839)
VTRATALFGHEPQTYIPHDLHRGERSYPETNCYTDVIIELVHARGDDPVSVLGSTVRMDFEGDQWTFFKPHNDDLEELLGIDIHEMQLYRPLEEHVVEQLAQGRTMIVELDAWYLPDTAATSYHAQHVKSSAAIEAIDLDRERLRYYHNQSLHQLHGEDYRGAFRAGLDLPGDVLPPYAEVVRFDDTRRLTGSDLVDAARRALRGHMDRAPATNPFVAFGQRLERDLPELLESGLGEYHDYAFATVRMAGAGFELCAAHAMWALGAAAQPACDAFDEIVASAKLLGFKLARRRAFDPSPTVAAMADGWERALGALGEALG